MVSKYVVISIKIAYRWDRVSD